MENVSFPSFYDIDPTRSARTAESLYNRDEKEFIVLVANAVLEAMKEEIRTGTAVKQPFATAIIVPMGTDRIYEYQTSLQLVINNSGARFLGVFDLYDYPVGKPDYTTPSMVNHKLEMNIEGFTKLQIVSQIHNDWVWVMNYDYLTNAGSINQKSKMTNSPTTYTYKESQLINNRAVFKFVDNSDRGTELIWGTSEGIGYTTDNIDITYMTFTGSNLGKDGSSLIVLLQRPKTALIH